VVSRIPVVMRKAGRKRSCVPSESRPAGMVTSR